MTKKKFINTINAVVILLTDSELDLIESDRQLKSYDSKYKYSVATCINNRRTTEEMMNRAVKALRLLGLECTLEYAPENNFSWLFIKLASVSH
jgi:hypothetical protein